MKKELVFLISFVSLFTLFLFRSYILNGHVPLPYNLLVSSYSPWKYENQFKQIPNKPLGFDNIKLFIPFRKYTTESLKQGIIPLWNPYVFSGNVHVATYQAAVFYPLSFVYYILSLEDGWAVLTMIQPILTAAGMYLFVRSLRRSKGAALLAAFGFAFSGWMITNWQEVHVQVHTIMYLPFALYASVLVWENTSKKSFLAGSCIFILACLFSVFAGFLQMSIYFFTVLGIWNLYLYFKTKNKQKHKKLLWITNLTLTSLALTAPQWLPAVEAFLFSPRGIVDSKILFQSFLSPLWFLLTLVVPDFFGNQGAYNYFSPLIFVTERTVWIALPILIFGASAFFIQKKGFEHIWFWLTLTIVTLSLGLNIPTSWIWYFLNIPVMNAAQPSRIFVLTALGISILAAYGFDSWSKTREKKPIVMVQQAISTLLFLLTTSLLLLGILQFIFKQDVYVCNLFQSISITCSEKLIQSYMHISLKNIVLPIIVCIISILTFKFAHAHRRFIFIVSILIILGSSAYQANKILYFSNRSFAYPSIPAIDYVKEHAGINRVTSIGDGHILRNFLSYYSIYSAEGYDALFPQWYGELLYSAKTQGKHTTQITRTDADLTPPGTTETIESNPYRLRLMQLLNVRYVLRSTHTEKKDEQIPPLPEEQFTQIWKDSDWQIYEYKTALPRAFLARTIKKTDSLQEQLDIIFSPTTSLSDTVVLDTTAPDLPPSSMSTDSANIISYKPNEVIIQTSSLYDRVLFLADTFVPGWKAYIDNTEHKIYKANYAFRAVFVPAGNHTITFRYEPISWRISIILASIGLFSISLTSLVYLSRFYTSD